MSASPARALLALAAVACLALGPLTARAAVVVSVWTLTATPLTAQLGVPTTFKLTLTNENALSALGCLRVDATSQFTITSASISNGIPWATTVVDHQLTAQSSVDGGELGLLESAVIAVKATAEATGTVTWQGRAYARRDCSGGAMAGLALIAIVVTQGPPTPTPPLPTPTPTPKLTPSPTPVPTVVPSLPAPSVPVPSLPVPSLPAPSLPASSLVPSPGPTSSAGQTPSPSSPGASPGTSSSASGDPSSSAPTTPTATLVTASGDPGASPIAGGGAVGGGGGAGSGTGTARDLFDVGPDRALAADLDNLDLGPSVGLTLAVPAILLSAPGLLLILAFLAQVAGGAAWISVVRRNLGREPAVPSRRFVRRG